MSVPHVIDPQAIENLRALSPDDGGFVRELAEIYLQDARTRVAEVEQSILNQDTATLTRSAHTLKGSSSNFGATRFVNLALSMETHGKTGNLTAAADLLPEFKAEYARVAEAIAGLLNNAG